MTLREFRDQFTIGDLGLELKFKKDGEELELKGFSKSIKDMEIKAVLGGKDGDDL